MYGMIHRALAEMVGDRGGDRPPGRVALLERRRPELFVSGASFGDDVTQEVVEAACADLGLDADRLFGEFGEFWIEYAQRGPFGSIMSLAGATLPEFIAGLDKMHVGVNEAIPEASMPSFRLLSVSGRELIVGYTSGRSGLEPFVNGLLRGLLTHFGHTGTVEQLARDANAGTKFRIVLDESC